MWYVNVLRKRGATSFRNVEFHPHNFLRHLLDSEGGTGGSIAPPLCQCDFGMGPSIATTQSHATKQHESPPYSTILHCSKKMWLSHGAVPFHVIQTGASELKDTVNHDHKHRRRRLGSIVEEWSTCVALMVRHPLATAGSSSFVYLCHSIGIS